MKFRRDKNNSTFEKGIHFQGHYFSQISTDSEKTTEGLELQGNFLQSEMLHNSITLEVTIKNISVVLSSLSHFFHA